MTVVSFDPAAPAVTMTAPALKHFREKLAAAEQQMVRLSTRVSGCTGYAYVLDLVDGPEPGDKIVHVGDDISLAVDRTALDLVRGTEIDFVLEGVNKTVKFNNPNVTAACGCGESFSVAEEEE